MLRLDERRVGLAVRPVMVPDEESRLVERGVHHYIISALMGRSTPF
ncbi:MAG TPA: hypothetical protein VMS31_06655 [Pyrinomonadaceae bacterium]|nr:hypothetical protein [Pyrinomonadaceae bacterium]